jgi:hypothetical protein
MVLLFIFTSLPMPLKTLPIKIVLNIDSAKVGLVRYKIVPTRANGRNWHVSNRFIEGRESVYYLSLTIYHLLTAMKIYDLLYTQRMIHNK